MSAMTLHPIPIAPTGRQEGQILFRGRLVDAGFNTYPLPCPEAEELRRVRQGSTLFPLAFVSLREMASRLGLTATQLSSLETGKETLPAEEWTTLLAAVRAAKGGA